MGRVYVHNLLTVNCRIVRGHKSVHAIAKGGVFRHYVLSDNA